MPLKMQAELSTLLFFTQLLMSELHTGHFSLLLWFFSLVGFFCFVLGCFVFFFFKHYTKFCSSKKRQVEESLPHRLKQNLCAEWALQLSTGQLLF